MSANEIEEAEDLEYLLTYSDMITLLAFFAILIVKYP